MTNEQDTWKSRPNEWSDDERMNALFAPFRNRDINPIYYDAKINFWKKTIKSYINEHKLIKFKIKDLEDAFLRNGTKPKCLAHVIENMLQENLLIKEYNEFIKPQQTWLSYAFTKLVWSPLSWTTGYLIKKTDIGSRLTFLKTQYDAHLSQTINDDLEFINLEELSKKSNDIYNKLNSDVIYNEIDCICDYDTFKDLCMSEQVVDCDLVIIQLLVENKLLIETNLIKNKKLLKFLTLNKKHLNKIESISELELSYYLLKLTEINIEKQVNALNTKISQLTNDIKELIKQKSSQSQALNMLKRRKHFEKQLDNTMNTLLNVQNMMLNMQQIDTNKMTIDVYRKSLDVLKQANKANDLDKIEDLIDDIQENFKMNSEIEDTLAKSFVGTTTNDDLEDELNELLASTTNTAGGSGGGGDGDKLTQNFQNLSIDDLLNDLPSLPSSRNVSINNPEAV